MKDFIGVKIALLHDNQLVMIQRDNKPGLSFAGMWDFPGGGREGNETPEECIIREVEEELALHLKSEQIIWNKLHPAMIDPAQEAHFMVAKISDNDIANITFGDEGQGWRMFDIDEFFSSNNVVEHLKGRLKPFLDSKVQE